MENSSRKSRSVNLAAIFFFLIGLGIFILSTFVPLGGRNADGDPGSLLIPIISAAFLVVLSFYTFVVNFSKNTWADEWAMASTLIKPFINVLIPITVFITMFEILGAFISISGLLCGYLFLSGYPKKLSIVIISLGTSLMVCLIFGYLLRVPMPGGLLGWP